MHNSHALNIARELGFYGFSDALERQLSDPLYADIAFLERLMALLVAEREQRSSARLVRMLKEAKLPTRAAPEDLINTTVRGLKPDGIKELLRCDWVPHAWNILITGETGTGKTWLGACIATAAIRQGHKARYFKTTDLLYSFSLTMEDGIYLRERDKLNKFGIIILDDFGKIEMNEREKSILFDIIDDRAGRFSTIIVGQRPYNDWHSFIGTPVIADAIMDRLSRDKYHINLKGESLRKREASFKSL